MTQRTIDALRALAERPGTEAEGKLARDLLARVESGRTGVLDAEEDEAEACLAFRRHMRGEISMDEFLAVMRSQGAAAGEARARAYADALVDALLALARERDRG